MSFGFVFFLRKISLEIFVMGFATYSLKLECHPLFHFSVNLLCSQVLASAFSESCIPMSGCFQTCQKQCCLHPSWLCPLVTSMSTLPWVSPAGFWECSEGTALPSHLAGREVSCDCFQAECVQLSFKLNPFSLSITDTKSSRFALEPGLCGWNFKAY